MSSEQKEWVKQLSLVVTVSSILTSYSVGGVMVGYFAFLKLGTPKILSAVTGIVGLVLGIMKLTKWVKKQQ